MIDQVLVIIGVTLLVMVSPGPDMVIVMRNTMVGGQSAGLRTSLGILTGNLVHISYCVAGIGWLISQSIVAFSVLRYAGAAYLVYLGLMSFREQTSALTEGSLPARSRPRTWYLQGFINNVLNPKGTLFYLGVFTIVITPDTTAGVTLLLIAIMISISALFWVFFVFTLGRPAIRQLIDRFQTLTNRIFGTLLIALGLRVALLDR